MQVLHLGSEKLRPTQRWLSDLGIQSPGFCSGPSRASEDLTAKGMALKKALAKKGGFQEILVQKEAELARGLRAREGIAIETSADQMDEVQYASQRELAIRNADRESILLHQIRAALRRVHDDRFGASIECEWAISPERLAAVPWASRCIECQDAADHNQLETTEPLSETLSEAA